MQRQIIALGGGGFSREPDNPLLDRYILAQAVRPNPNVCFIGTAGGDAQTYLDKFYEAFRRWECRPSHLSLSQPPEGNLAAFVAGQDIVYVGGGSVRNWLQRWRDCRLDRMLRAAWEAGVVLAGVSAGAMCWFGHGITRPQPGEFIALTGIGLLPGSFCPHYDGEPDRCAAYRNMVRTGALAPGYGVDDGAALHFIGDALHGVVSSRPGARAHRVTLSDGAAIEAPLPVTYLGT